MKIGVPKKIKKTHQVITHPDHVITKNLLIINTNNKLTTVSTTLIKY